MPVRSSRIDVDLFSQTLPEVIIRNKYGGFNVAAVAKNVDANADIELISIIGTGYIYSTVWVTYGTDVQHDDYAYVVIDGVRSNSPTYKQLFDWGSFPVATTLPYLGCYDEVNYLYAVGWEAKVTFEESVKDCYHEAHGRTPYIMKFILYAVI